LPLAVEKKDSLPDFVIIKRRSYMTLGPNFLKYCHSTNYLVAGTLLSKFYSAYKVKSFKEAPSLMSILTARKIKINLTSSKITGIKKCNRRRKAKVNHQIIKNRSILFNS